MTHDDAHTSHNHGFELPDVPQAVARNESRPWRALAGVALCLGLAGVVAGLIVARRQSLSDEHLTSDALQREELRDGWRTLGAAAAQDAQASGAQPSAVTTATPAPANVVIVNVPGQAASAAPSNLPPNVTNINVPTGFSTPANGAPTNGAPTAAPSDRAAPGAGYTPNQSLPPINFSPVPGYLPLQMSNPSSGDTPQTVYQQQYGYGTSTGGVAPLSPPVGNGSIPGSTPNPALPNNGLVGSTPVPGLPNGPTNGTTSSSNSSAPIGGVPASPGTSSLPSGFSTP